MTDRGDETDGCDVGLHDVGRERLSNRPSADQVEFFSTLGNETRLRILLLLTEAEGPICGCELEPYLDVGQSSVSQSLNRLRDAGLVTRTKDGRWRYYKPTPTAERLVELIEDDARDKPLITE